MTLQEAIAISTKERNDHHSFPTDIIGKAAQLGIEALEREQHRRKYDIHLPVELFPSETED